MHLKVISILCLLNCAVCLQNILNNTFQTIENENDRKNEIGHENEIEHEIQEEQENDKIRDLEENSENRLTGKGTYRSMTQAAAYIGVIYIIGHLAYAFYTDKMSKASRKGRHFKIRKQDDVVVEDIFVEPESIAALKGIESFLAKNWNYEFRFEVGSS